jgi:hypothetical protein
MCHVRRSVVSELGGPGFENERVIDLTLNGALVIAHQEMGRPGEHAGPMGGHVMLDRLRALLGRRRTAEDDVEPDTALARSRDTGGSETAEADGATTTTGTGANEGFVGRVAGDDAGADEQTGAEARSERDRE